MTRVRKFQERDLDEVVHIARSSLHTDYDPRLYLSIWELWPDGFLVAEERGRIVGFIAGMLENEMDAKILMIAVHRHFRREGVGRALMNSFISACTLVGIKRVYLEVRVSNRDAIEFYRASGFSKGSIYPRYYEDGEDALIMWRTL